MNRFLVPLCVAVAFGAASPALAQDESDLVVRINRLEGQIRTLSGQVEQTQYENRQLKEQLRKFQEDTEFRFQERSGGSGSRPAPASSQPSTTPSAGGGSRPQRRGDAFDPEASPGAPGTPGTLGGGGAPRSLGGTPETGPVVGGNPDAARTGARAARSAANAEEDGRPSVAATGAGARTDYDAAYAAYTGKQYDQAEMGFRRFIQSNPRDRMVPDATYWLGESYLQRNRPREAAEQFLKISTDYGRSTKAPDALLKLGVALSAIGAKEQACATFAELERKYPNASTSVRQGVDREQKRVRCPS